MVLDNLWLGDEESQAIATALQPKLTRTRSAVEALLQDVSTLDTALRHGSDPVTLANLLPRHWADFIRNRLVVSILGCFGPVNWTVHAQTACRWAKSPTVHAIVKPSQSMCTQ